VRPSIGGGVKRLLQAGGSQNERRRGQSGYREESDKQDEKAAHRELRLTLYSRVYGVMRQTASSWTSPIAVRKVHQILTNRYPSIAQTEGAHGKSNKFRKTDG
jgi:hypothetical protein